jgi:hypothetical protein
VTGVSSGGSSGSLQITKQPVSVTIKRSEKAVFSIEATGSGLTYQWQYSNNSGSTWTNLTEGTGASGTTTNTVTRSNFYMTISNQLHRCIVTDSSGNQVISNTASLTVTS